MILKTVNRAMIFLVLTTLTSGQMDFFNTMRINCKGRLAICVGDFSYSDCTVANDGNTYAADNIIACPANSRCVNDATNICISKKPVNREPVTDAPPKVLPAIPSRITELPNTETAFEAELIPPNLTPTMVIGGEKSQPAVDTTLAPELMGLTIVSSADELEADSNAETVTEGTDPVMPQTAIKVSQSMFVAGNQNIDRIAPGIEQQAVPSSLIAHPSEAITTPGISISEVTELVEAQSTDVVLSVSPIAETSGTTVSYSSVTASSAPVLPNLDENPTEETFINPEIPDASSPLPSKKNESQSELPLSLQPEKLAGKENLEQPIHFESVDVFEPEAPQTSSAPSAYASTGSILQPEEGASLQNNDVVAYQYEMTSNPQFQVNDTLEPNGPAPSQDGIASNSSQASSAAAPLEGISSTPQPQTGFTSQPNEALAPQDGITSNPQLQASSSQGSNGAAGPQDGSASNSQRQTGSPLQVNDALAPQDGVLSSPQPHAGSPQGTNGTPSLQDSVASTPQPLAGSTQGTNGAAGPQDDIAPNPQPQASSPQEANGTAGPQDGSTSNSHPQTDFPLQPNEPLAPQDGIIPNPQPQAGSLQESNGAAGPQNDIAPNPQPQAGSLEGANGAAGPQNGIAPNPQPQAGSLEGANGAAGPQDGSASNSHPQTDFPLQPNEAIAPQDGIIPNPQPQTGSLQGSSSAAALQTANSQRQTDPAPQPNDAVASPDGKDSNTQPKTGSPLQPNQAFAPPTPSAERNPGTEQHLSKSTNQSDATRSFESDESMSEDSTDSRARVLQEQAKSTTANPSVENSSSGESAEHIADTKAANEKMKKLIKSLKKRHTCNKDDILPDIKKCRKFYRCVSRSGKRELRHLRCDHHNHFDYVDLKCVDKSKARCLGEI